MRVSAYVNVCTHSRPCNIGSMNQSTTSQGNLDLTHKTKPTKKHLIITATLAFTADAVPDRLIKLGSLWLSIRNPHYGESGWNALYQCFQTLLIRGSGRGKKLKPALGKWLLFIHMTSKSMGQITCVREVPRYLPGCIWYLACCPSVFMGCTHKYRKQVPLLISRVCSFPAKLPLVIE